jgi:hypothetical protein
MGSLAIIIKHVLHHDEPAQINTVVAHDHKVLDATS